ncbi:hypothetical protein FB567DRAFT_39502 [Paraphoma chrysanthemicola]|uniref:Uncharacterized protein n=1 Tax=Paraphoma chrysanthemicola TaxID=798071 RepID=A0A8K0W4J8_9PLEO|nr:hypothetical protein FB567DRAFT_39502 [Paraphoma chrysanthemicola]
MRLHLAPLVLAPLAALAAQDIYAPFEPAVAQLSTTDNTTVLGDGSSSNNNDPIELLRRQNGNACATNYYACAAVNAPGLCCPRTAICTADSSRNVACCPQGAVCTGALGVPAATGTSFVLASTTTTFATTNTNQPFVQVTTAPNAAQRSTVQNAFFPFAYIATTYINAASCSAAYTSCQADAASCTTALANGAQGVTVSAPNGGATITAVPSVGLASAQSICASLSSQACYGLQVEACRSFDGQGNAAPTGACKGWGVAAGVAVGLAGQMLR